MLLEKKGQIRENSYIHHVGWGVLTI